MSSAPNTPQPVADALEQRDPWRDAWQAATHDVLVGSLSLIVAVALTAGYLLPQAPAGGTADPLSYSQWQTQARAVAGSFFDGASVLGLFNVAQAFWLRIVIAILAVILGLRLIDRVARMASSRRRRGRGDALRDEERVRVTNKATPLADIVVRLRKRRYRVSQSPQPEQAEATGGTAWLVIDRAPVAELFSIVLHIGLLIALAGVVLNSTQGWEVARQQVDTESPTALQRGKLGLQLVAVDDAAQTAVLNAQGVGQPVVLAVGARGAMVWSTQLPLPCCLSLRLNELIPGYHVSAIDDAGRPLTITVSSYAEPVRDVLLTIRRDEPGRLVSVESASMAVLVSEDKGGRVQVYGVPSGKVLTDTAISASIVISATTLQFRPTMSVVVAAQYRPGDVFLWVGGVLAVLGLLAVALWPMQRLVVRNHGYWTEFYACGRGVRGVVRELLTQETTQQHDN